MIKELKLKFGGAQGSGPLSVLTTPVTLFVGPNNSGKSKLLSEIERFTRNGASDNTLILQEIKLHGLSADEAQKIINKMSATPLPSDHLHPGHSMFQAKGERFQVPLTQFLDALKAPGGVGDTRVFAWFLRFFTIMLNGPTRINLVNAVSCGDLQSPGQNAMQYLFRDDELRTALRKKIFDAFQLYLCIDPTNPGNLRLRLSDVPPPSSEVERGWNAQSVAFHGAADPIEQYSDGVKAFVGILLEVFGGEPQVLLIDEPEAFLHPSLAFKLGSDIATQTKDSKKQLFVSTHSPDFLMGCIQSGSSVTVVRLTYRAGAATARVLSNDKILHLMRNPLLRSTGILAGLFYEYVIVTEADADRAFYQEINYRLLHAAAPEGTRDALFVNAQGRQTVDQLIGPLRELGIPAAAIVDIDVIKEGGVVFSRLLAAAYVPQITQQSLIAARAHLKNAFDATGRDMTVDGGINLLDGENYDAAIDFIRSLSTYGIFVVANGALESWLHELGGDASKRNWLPTIFEKMGDDPGASTYIQPASDDVWNFMRTLRRWLVDPDRKGIPS